MHKRPKMHNAHRLWPMATNARPPSCIMPTRRMHNLHFLDIPACIIRISAMHDVHHARARCTRRRNPDGHVTHGPAGGRTRIYSRHKDKLGLRTTTREDQGRPAAVAHSLHLQPGLKARLPAKNHNRPATGRWPPSAPASATDPDFGDDAQDYSWYKRCRGMAASETPL